VPTITPTTPALRPFFTAGAAIVSNPQRVRYDDAPRKPDKWILDADGTLFLRQPGGRGPFDWDRVSEDMPNMPVIRVVRALAYAGESFVVVSGRLNVCWKDTVYMLYQHVFTQPSAAWNPEHLFMRDEARQYMPDHELKRELLYQELIPRYNIVGAIDDRHKVVEMWRQEGIFCMQVADGNF
jgi:hypothetical protein